MRYFSCLTVFLKQLAEAKDFMTGKKPVSGEGQLPIRSGGNNPIFDLQAWVIQKVRLVIGD
jgi:hypothetical protein